VLLAEVADDESLWRIADSIRRVVELGRIPVDGVDLWATVTVGAVRSTETLRHADALLDAAEAALRTAGRRGRNQTEVHGFSGGALPEADAIRIAEALALSASLREGMPLGHCHEVASLAGGVAEELGLPADVVLRCRLGGWLHDVGKVGIPDRILGKRGPLEAIDWEVIRAHPELGEEIVASVPALAASGPAVRHHHERWDGSGYPDGLEAESIPIEARIVAAADAYAAITTAAPFRKPRDHRAALAELRASAGSHLDPAVVEALVVVLTRERSSSVRAGARSGPAGV
jgi:HD-GYP domain-containing protein (c-di-GMP phosphodiesterase class II)